jgi:hypothetical protein
LPLGAASPRDLQDCQDYRVLLVYTFIVQKTSHEASTGAKMPMRSLFGNLVYPFLLIMTESVPLFQHEAAAPANRLSLVYFGPFHHGITGAIKTAISALGPQRLSTKACRVRILTDRDLRGRRVSRLVGGAAEVERRERREPKLSWPT